MIDVRTLVRTVAIAPLFFLASACNSAPATDATGPASSDNCSVPDADVYICEGGVTGEGACGAFGMDGDASLDALYTVGCVVRLPEPSGFYRGSATCPHPAQECECGLVLDGGPGWACRY